MLFFERAPVRYFIDNIHLMRILLNIALLCIALPIHGQKSNKEALLLLSQIGKTIYDFNVAATTADYETGFYQWRFVMAEEALKGKVTPELGSDLTTFVYNYNPETYRYNGEIVRSRTGLDSMRTLGMIYFQLQQNLLKVGNQLEIIKMEDMFYYVLYFPN